MTADAALLAALADLAAALENVGEPAMIIGGIAVIARGIPRDTVDIDATIWAERVDLDGLFSALGANGIVPRVPDGRSFARRHQVLLLRHAASGTPLEIVLAWLPFEREALARASVVDFGGVKVRTAQAEDLLVYKTIAWRERDRADVERLLVRHAGSIDLARVRAQIAEFADVLDADRLAEFDRLVRRALGSGSV
ncbi:MAG: hypothetical protein ACE148_00700 [Vicinamibacterales bacterium]